MPTTLMPAVRIHHDDPEAQAEPDTYPPCDTCEGAGHAGRSREDACTRCGGTGIEPPTA